MTKLIKFEDVAHVTSEEYFKDCGSFSIDVYKSKYPQDEIEAQFPAKLFRRLAKTAAKYEATPELQEYWANRWFSEMWEGYWRPAGSIMSGLGSDKKVSIANCTTIELKEDTLESIFETSYKVAKSAAYRQGLGVDFSALRPRGSKIKNSAKISTGAVGWMDFVNKIGHHVGQCLHPQTNILTTDGYKTIDEIVNNRLKDTVFCPTKPSKIINWFRNPEKTIYEITTEYGDKLLMSEDHILQGIDKEKPLKDFKINEYIVSRRILDYPEPDYIVIPEFLFIKSPYNNSNRISVPVKYPKIINEELAYLIGLMYGNGYITATKSIELALETAHPKIKRQVNQFLINLFGAEIGSYGIGIRPGDGAVETLSLGRWYYEFFNSIGCIKGESFNLIFPEVIKQSPKSVLFAFFSGMFDADGYNSNTRKNIELCSTDYNFMYTLKLELSKYGVITCLKTSTYLTHKNKLQGQKYRLSIVGNRSRDILYENTLSAKLFLKDTSQYDRLKTPYKLKNIKLSLSDTDGDVNTSDFLSDIKYSKYTSIVSKLYIQKIKSITKLKSKSITYDITIEDESHLFMADNILVKNSGRVPAMLFSISVKHPDVIEFLTAKSNQNMIPNANISVQITDDFMHAYENDLDWELSFYVKDNDETIIKTIKAKALMNMLAKEAHGFAEPGVQFIDTCKRESMTDVVGYPIRSTNAPVIGTSLIATEQGLIPIKELYRNKKNINLLYYNPYSGIDPQFVEGRIRKYKNQKVWKIRLKGGPELSCNSEHSWLTTRGMIETKNLTESDRIVYNNYGIAEIKKSKVSNNENYKDGLLCGWLTGDGFFINKSRTKKKGIGLLWNSEDNSFIFDLFKEKYQSEVGSEFSFIRDRGNNLKETVSYSSEILKYFKQFGYVDNKYIIPDLTKTDLNFAVGFLRALYETDGSSDRSMTKGSGISLTSINREMVFKVQQLLLGWFGIKSTINMSKSNPVKYVISDGTTKFSNHKPRYNLIISSFDGIVKFEKWIGFLSQRKQEKLRSLVKSKENERHTTTQISYEISSISETSEVVDMYCAVVDNYHGFIIDGCSSSNCSEKFMTPDSTCVLASMNVGIFPFIGYEEKVSEISKSMTRFLDNCITYELTENKTPFPSQHLIVSKLREIGIGFTNLNGWLIEQGIAYDSDAGIGAMTNFIKFASIESWKETISLGKEKGNAPAFQDMLDKIGNNSFIYESDFARRLRDEAGIDITHCRNLNVMSIAPTGSLSLVFPQMIESTGIEPFIGFYWWKRTRVSGKWEWYFVIPGFVRNKLMAEGYKDVPTSVLDNDGEVGEKWISIITKYFDPNIFKPAHYIDPLKKVDFMSGIAKWIDSSISVTYNLKEDVPVKTVEDIYYYGWKKGIKSISVYRDRSRQGVIEFESPKIVEKRFKTELMSKRERPEKIQIHQAALRPKVLLCHIHRTSIKGNKYIVLVGLLDGLPYEVFVAQEKDLEDITARLTEATIEKNGSGKYNLVSKDKIIIKDISSHIQHEYENTTRLISLSLRTGAPIDYIVEQLEKSKGTIVDSSQALARILKKYIGEYYRTASCLECGSSNVDYNSGCSICLDCGSSKCG